MDIFSGETKSHRKKIFSNKGKVPYVKEKLILKRGNKEKGLKKGDEIEINLLLRTLNKF
ncbi:MAG: hypothetical protein AVDCRST_MAG96-3761, partial [uncultured Segetibacter sp.]